MSTAASIRATVSCLEDRYSVRIRIRLAPSWIILAFPGKGVVHQYATVILAAIAAECAQIPPLDIVPIEQP
jgi:hypothetical protein